MPIDRQRRAPSSNGAAARDCCSNAGSATFTAAVAGWTQTLVLWRNGGGHAVMNERACEQLLRRMDRYRVDVEKH